MIGADSVVAIAAGLADLLQVKDHLPVPQLHLIFQPDSPHRRDDRIFLTLGAAFWQQRSREHHGAALTDVEQCVELLHATAGSWMPDLSQLPGATLVGCGLMYDEPAASAGAGPAGRVVITCDTDGRLYHGAALTDRSTRPLITLGKPPDARATAVADALATVLDHRIAAV